MLACPCWPSLIRRPEVPCTSEKGANRFHHNRSYLAPNGSEFGAGSSLRWLWPRPSGGIFDQGPLPAAKRGRAIGVGAGHTGGSYRNWLADRAEVHEQQQSGSAQRQHWGGTGVGWGGRWRSRRLQKLIDAEVHARISGLHDGGPQTAAGSTQQSSRSSLHVPHDVHMIMTGRWPGWAKHGRRLRPDLLGRGR